MASTDRNVIVYALSTCIWCRKTLAWLDEHGVQYQRIYMDLLDGQERERAQQEALRVVNHLSYPVLVIDGGRKVIQGYKPEQFEEELG